MTYTISFTVAILTGVCVCVAVEELVGRINGFVYRLGFEARLHGPQTGRLSVFGRLIRDKLLGLRAARALVHSLTEAGFRNSQSFAMWIMIFALPVLLGGLLILQSPLKLVVLTAMGGVFLRVWLKRRARDRLQKFAGQLPSILKSVSAALAAGSSVRQALVHVAGQVSAPATDELKIVNQQIALGMPLDESLENLHRRLPLTELKMIIAGLAIQRRIGGNLVGLLQEMTESLTERRRLQKHLSVETAQARLSAGIIGFLPLVVTGLIALIDPAYIEPLLFTPIGWTMLAIAIVAETSGFLLLNKILEIRL